MTALAESLVVYLSLCAVGTTAGLALIGLGCPDLRPGARLLLSPVTCLALWAVFLGGGVALGNPVRSLVGPLWVTTLALSFGGVWGLARRWGAATRQEPAALGLMGLAVVLPVAALWPFFWYGLADFPGSVAPDGWSYVAYGQYLWDHRRFDDGGLAPLYQYAAHLSITRHVSASLLDLLAHWTVAFLPTLPAGDAQVGVGLLLAWGLYAFGMACAAVGTLVGLRPPWTATYLILAVCSGWIGNAVYLNNFDNVTVLAFFPALATLIALVPAGSWRPAVHLGLLGAGLLYSYAELAPFVGAAVGFIAVHRLVRERLPLGRWSLTLALAVGVSLGLTAPYLQSLVAFVSLQSYNALTVRVGGTVFDGLLSAPHEPAAFWALGGEHRVNSHLRERNLLAGLFSLAALGGLWALFKQGQHAVIFTSGLVLAAFGVLAVKHAYAYGAYKVLLMGWWVIALLPVAGVAYLCRHASSRRASVVAGALAVLAAGSAVFHQGQELTRDFGRQLQNSMSPVRALQHVAGIVGDRGLLLAVDGDWANQWAVHFLRHPRMRVGTLRSYMAQPWVVPFMGRARVVPLDDIAYALTDHRLDGGLGGPDHPAVWSEGRYRLWSLPPGWAVLVDIRSPVGVDSREGRPLLWLSADSAELDLLTPRPGTLIIGGTCVAGPGGARRETFHVRAGVDLDERRDVALAPGECAIPVQAHAGLNRVTLWALDAADPPAPGGVALAILGLRDLHVWRPPTVQSRGPLVGP